MKSTLFLTLLVSGILTGCVVKDQTILDKTASRLNALKTIEYQEDHYLYAKTIEKTDTISVLCFFDFTSTDTLLGAKYQFSDNHGELVFNGKTEFSSDKNQKQIVYSDKLNEYWLNSTIYMANSIYVIRKRLPEFIKDSSTTFIRKKDTLVNGEENYQFDMILKDKDLFKGAIVKVEPGKSFTYNLQISKKNYLPTQFTKIYSENNGYWKTTFTQLNTKASRPDSTWYYDRFPADFIRMTAEENRKDYLDKKDLKKAAQIGQQSPVWSLPLISGGVQKLSDLKENLVLLEFWFPGCGGCVKAIPEINRIQEIYAKKKLKVFGVEFSNTKVDGLNAYIKKENIKYPTLHSGKSIAEMYGVNAGPTIFLIDKKGIIIYRAEGLNKEELIKVINENI